MLRIRSRKSRPELVKRICTSKAGTSGHGDVRYTKIAEEKQLSQTLPFRSTKYNLHKAWLQTSTRAARELHVNALAEARVVVIRQHDPTARQDLREVWAGRADVGVLANEDGV